MYTGREEYVKWRNGGLRLVFKNSFLEIISKNYRFILRPRIVIVEGTVKEYNVVSPHRHGKYKYVYIELSEEVKPFDKKGRVPRPGIIEGFEVNYQDMGFEEYLTIVTPGAFLYQYIILTTSMLTICLSAKKEAYIDLENNVVTIYVV